MQIVDEKFEPTATIKQFLKNSYESGLLKLTCSEELFLKHFLYKTSAELQIGKSIYELDKLMGSEIALYEICQSFSLLSGENIDWFINELERKIMISNANKVSSLGKIEATILLGKWGHRIGEAEKLIADVHATTTDKLRKDREKFKKSEFFKSPDHKNIEAIISLLGFREKYYRPLSKINYPRAYSAYIKAGLYVFEHKPDSDLIENFLHNCDQKSLEDAKKYIKKFQ